MDLLAKRAHAIVVGDMEAIEHYLKEDGVFVN